MRTVTYRSQTRCRKSDMEMTPSCCANNSSCSYTDGAVLNVCRLERFSRRIIGIKAPGRSRVWRRGNRARILLGVQGLQRVRRVSCGSIPLSGAALVVAATANGLDFYGPRVITVVPNICERAAVHAVARIDAWEQTLLNGLLNFTNRFSGPRPTSIPTVPAEESRRLSIRRMLAVDALHLRRFSCVRKCIASLPTVSDLGAIVCLSLIRRTVFG